VIVVVHDLSHKYGAREALSRVSFKVEAGSVFGLLGPNGSGKSTLFRILSTMIAPTEGRATVAGSDVVTQAEQVRRRIGVVFQSQSLDRKLTVDENLTAQGHLYGLSGSPLRKRVDETLSRLALNDRRGDVVGTLSGGLMRRVEIAKALLHAPDVLLMDEPSTGLDPVARREMWQYLDELRKIRELTILVTTHLLDEAERCGQLLLLHQGRIVAEGAPAVLKSKVGGDVVVLESNDPSTLGRRLAERFHVQPIVMDGTVRVEIESGHRFVAEAVEAFPGAIQSVIYHKPTLEDVFVDLTGAKI
jgi:ABC-2 type transport system ATP-binding protein